MSCSFFPLVLSIFCILLAPVHAAARLGHSISSFKSLNGERAVLKEVVIKDEKKYYSFDLLILEEKLARASGFKAGMTVTVRAGKITGQSLAISMGKNLAAANELAVEQSHVFACEALGRDLPREDDALQKEYGLIRQAIFHAVSGKPQELKFPGSEGRIIFKGGPQSSLLVAALPS